MLIMLGHVSVWNRGEVIHTLQDPPLEALLLIFTETYDGSVLDRIYIYIYIYMLQAQSDVIEVFKQTLSHNFIN